MKIKVDGMAQTRVLLKAIASKEEAAARKLVKEGAALVQERAMRTVPVDTGNLKRSILIDIAPDGLSGTVTATADYAAYVEYGTRFMGARPFMRPAAEQADYIMRRRAEQEAREATQ